MYYVYILENKNKNFHYIGYTKNLNKRIHEHKNGESSVTKGYLPIKLVWHCVFYNKQTAAKFEKYLKSGSGRAFTKKHLI